MIADALRYPFESDEWIKTVLIGTALSLLSVLILPILFVNGYMVRVLRAGSRRDPTPPVFDEWGELLIDGLRLVAVVLVYTFGPLLVGVVFTVVGAFGLSAGSEGVATVFAVGTILPGLLFLVALYLLPAALTGMARTGSIGGAFDLALLKTAVTSSTYLIAFVLALLVGLVLGVIGGLLSIILIGLVVSFYAQIVTFYLLGRGVGDAIGGGGRDETAAAPTAE